MKNGGSLWDLWTLLLLLWAPIQLAQQLNTKTNRIGCFTQLLWNCWRNPEHWHFATVLHILDTLQCIEIFTILPIFHRTCFWQVSCYSHFLFVTLHAFLSENGVFHSFHCTTFVYSKKFSINFIHCLNSLLAPSISIVQLENQHISFLRLKSTSLLSAR